MRSKPLNLHRWLLCAISLFTFLAVPARGHSQSHSQNWQSLNGPLADGGWVVSLSTAPSTPNMVYALIQDRWEERLYVSTDAADHWQTVQSFRSFGPYSTMTTPFEVIRVDPTDGQVLYAYGMGSEVQRSLDGGETWATILQTPVTSLQPAGGGRVYAVWYGQDQTCTAASTLVGFFGRSDDYGQHWTTSSLGCADLSFVYIDAGQPELVYVGGGKPGPKMALWRSVNGGQDWQDLSGSPSGNFGIIHFVMDPTHPGVMVVETTFSEIYRSADDGQSWTKTWDYGNNLTSASNSLVFIRQIVDPVEGRLGFSIFHSVDGGLTWWEAQDRLPEYGFLVNDPSSAGRMYAGTHGYGVWRSDSSGAEWEERNHGIQVEAEVKILAYAPSDPNILYAVSQSPRPGIYRSDDRGQSWSGRMPMDAYAGRTAPAWVSASIQVEQLAVDPQNPDNAWAGGYQGVFAWSKAAQKWVPGPVPHAYGVYDITFASNQAGVLCVAEALHQGSINGSLACTNQADSFHSINTYPIPFIDWVFAVAFDPRNSKHIFAAGIPKSPQHTVIAVSEDGGVNWRKVFDQAPVSYGMRLYISPVNPNQIVLEKDQSIYISMDNGESWKYQEGSVIEPYPARSRIWFDTLGSMYRLGGDGIYHQLPGQASWSYYWKNTVSSIDKPLDFVLLPGEPGALIVARRDGLFMLDLPIIQRVWLPMVIP